MTVTKIGLAAEPDTDMIAKAEDALKHAKSGHYVAVGYAMVRRDGAVSTAWKVCGRGRTVDMLAAAHHLAWRIHRALDEDRSCPEILED